MLAEDFSFLSKRGKLGIFFYVGTKTPKYFSGLHTNHLYSMKKS